MKRIPLLSVFVLASCTQATPGPTDATPLVVHEWGTFTSMVGSEGAPLVGLQHEETTLPAFVYSRSGELASAYKGLEITPQGVNEKLETPVLYFYTGAHAAPMSVAVDVSFPQGVLSQWFPNVTTFSPPLSPSGFPVTGGALHWQVNLVPGLAGFPTIDPHDIWAPARAVSSTPVEDGTEHEQFLFYRGLGAFTMPFTVSSASDGTLTLANGSTDPIADSFVLDVSDTTGSVRELGGLAASQSMTGVAPSARPVPIDTYIADAKSRVAAALVTTGLYPDEAHAMVETWSQSYFATPGVRVLYLVPRTWTDRLLPLHIDPPPTALVRTLVGRVEIISPDVEGALAARIAGASSTSAPAAPILASLGRFAEPELRDVYAHLADSASRAYCQSLIDLAATQP